MDTFINSEDPDEMPHYAAFHQGLYCLLGKKDLQTKKNTTFKNYKKWLASHLLVTMEQV